MRLINQNYKLIKILICLILVTFILYLVDCFEDLQKLGGSTFYHAKKEYENLYDGDYENIIKDIESNIDGNLAVFDVSIQKLLLLHYKYLVQDFDYVMDNFEDVYTILQDLNLEYELIHLYLLLSQIYSVQENYQLSYIYVQKAELLCENLSNQLFLRKPEREEYENILVGIKYIEVSILSNLNLPKLADTTFKQAELLRDSHDLEDDSYIYLSIIEYYSANEDYNKVVQYYNEFMSIDKNNITEDKVKATVLLTQLQIINGDIDEAITGVEFIEKYKSFSSLATTNLYELYSDLYAYHGNTDEAIFYLEKAFTTIKDYSYNTELKLGIVNKIIDLYESNGVVEEDWHVLYRELNNESRDNHSTQLILTELLDLELRAINEKQFSLKLLFINICAIFAFTVTLLFIVIRRISMKNYEDGLTKVYNRKLFDNVYNKLLNNKKDFYIIMFDIDNFKNVNDNYGHDFGDKVLIGICNTVRNILGPNSRLYRYGGEEFIVITKSASRKAVSNLAESIRSSVENIKWKNIDKVTISIGVASYEDHLDNVLKQADNNLYISKHDGKNKVTM